jgi:penicillin-binding protein 2
MSAFSSWEVSRRATISQWIILAAFAVLASAFFRAQVVNHDSYRTRSDRNYLRDISLEPPRGAIVDRHGEAIATNATGYSIRLLGTREDSLRAVLERLDSLIPGDTVDAETVVQRWETARYQPALVYASGSYDVVATLEEHRAALPGLVIQREPRRRYPDSNAVAHLVGYVGEVSSADLARNAFPGARSGEIVGKQGLELEYDSLLRGQRGVRFVEIDAKGRMIRDAPSTASLAAEQGKLVRTTIDMGLQRFIDSMWRADPYLTAKRGAMLAMTPGGEILAYSSFPSYNPNEFVGHIDQDTWDDALNDPNKPLINRVIRAAYPPASPFKLAIAAMALRRGYTMDSKMREPCTGSYQFGNRAYRCWNPRGHGFLTLRGAIASSCDVYFYQLGQLLGADSILAAAKEFGFGEKAGVDLDNEHAGTLMGSMKAYVNSRGVSTWSNGEVLNLSIGQGRHTETLMNMVSFYAALAGDGIKRTPHIIEGRTSTETHDLKLTPEQLSDLRLAMEDVVNSGTATGNLASEVGLKEFHIAGKTGSAQVTGQKDMAWFIAFAPADAPKIVVGIAVEEGVHGANVAKFPVRAIIHFLTGKTTKADIVNVTEDMKSSGSDTASTPIDSTPAAKPPHTTPKRQP